MSFSTKDQMTNILEFNLIFISVINQVSDTNTFGIDLKWTEWGRLLLGKKQISLCKKVYQNVFYSSANKVQLKLNIFFFKMHPSVSAPKYQITHNVFK